MKMFGQRIKKLRKERGAALKQVADASGLSQGYLSQIETDKVEPSIAMLRRLSSYYMVSLLYFFDTDPVDGVVVRKNERKIINGPHAPVTYEMLLHDVTNKKMEFSIIKLAPHYSAPRQSLRIIWRGMFPRAQRRRRVRTGGACLHAERGRQHILREL